LRAREIARHKLFDDGIVLPKAGCIADLRARRKSHMENGQKARALTLAING
jgi:hypothetical protein